MALFQLTPASGFCSFSIRIGCIIISSVFALPGSGFESLIDIDVGPIALPARIFFFDHRSVPFTERPFPSIATSWRPRVVVVDDDVLSVRCSIQECWRSAAVRGAIGIWRTPLFSRGCSSTGLRSTCPRLEPRYFDADALRLAISSNDISSVT